MEDLSSHINMSAEDRNDALLTHAHTENRYLAREVLDGILTYARVCIWVTWPRTDD